MSDLTDKLRQPWPPSHSEDPLMTEAADEIDRLTAENERLRTVINAADRGTPIYKAIERTLDEKSAWIARPNAEVTNAIALTAGIAWSIHYPLEVVEQNLSLQLGNHRLTARVKELEEALTPSAATKAAYIGEFAFEEEYLDEDGNEAVRKITVPWTTVKEIMAAIRARAALTPQQGEK